MLREDVALVRKIVKEEIALRIESLKKELELPSQSVNNPDFGSILEEDKKI